MKRRGLGERGATAFPNLQGQGLHWPSPGRAQHPQHWWSTSLTRWWHNNLHLCQLWSSKRMNRYLLKAPKGRNFLTTDARKKCQINTYMYTLRTKYGKTNIWKSNLALLLKACSYPNINRQHDFAKYTLLFVKGRLKSLSTHTRC